MHLQPKKKKIELPSRVTLINILAGDKQDITKIQKSLDKSVIRCVAYPYEKTLVAFHLAMTEAYSPITRAEQSNSMWKPSDISPRLLVHTPYIISTNVIAWKQMWL